MKYTEEQLKQARINEKIKSECPEWMQELFESAPSGKLWWYSNRRNGWVESVNTTWNGGIYAISLVWNGEI